MSSPRDRRSAMFSAPAHDQALLDLLAERALHGLDPAEHQKLDEQLRRLGLEDDESLDLAAAAAMLSMTPVEVAPASVYTRCVEAGRSFERERVNNVSLNGAPSLRLTDDPPVRAASRRMNSAWIGWIAAAACMVFATIGWLQMFSLRQRFAPEPVVTLADLRREVDASADLRRAPWGDWDNPEVKGVTGEIVWSQSLQKGYMVFKGLPANDPTKEQYQLWIVDDRGIEHRVSGGIFNASADTTGWRGEVRTQRVGDDLIVEVEPRIFVRTPTLFALTIEEPGGTWLSTMKRRVVAAKPS